jgi:hypothetical protein
MRELSCLGMAAASVFGRGVLSRALEAATTSMYMAAGRGGGGVSSPAPSALRSSSTGTSNLRGPAVVQVPQRRNGSWWLAMNLGKPYAAKGKR